MRWLALLPLLLSVAHAAPRRVAVLELRDVAGVTRPVAAYLTDRVRTAGLAVPGDRYFVMTRENILAQLPPGTDLAACEGDCEVETGRNLGADLVISGEILKLDAALRVSLKVHDTASGKLVAAETAAGDSPAALEASLGQVAARLFERLPAPAPPVVGGGEVQVGVAVEQAQPVVNAPVADHLGFLVIDTDPPGGRVLLNGVDVGVAPLQREEPTGTHLLEARLPLHYAAAQEVVLTREGARVVLKLPPAHGRLEVESDPPGAVVRLGGEVVGQTPFVAAQKASGRHLLRVEAPCRRPLEQPVEVRDGQTTRHVLVLEPACGSVQVDSDPPGASVVLNGTDTGRTTPARFDDLQPGVATLRLTRAGHGEAVQRVSVEPRETKAVLVKLTPKLGLLSVLAVQKDGRPCTGALHLDGQAVGAAPWKGEVTAQRHEVAVHCPDGVAWGRTEVAHNARTSLTVRVGEVLGSGPCDAQLSACLAGAGIDDRVYRACIHEADQCTQPTAATAQATPRGPGGGATVGLLVQSDRLRDHYLLQGVVWLGAPEARLRLGLAASALNLHIPADTDAAFEDFGFSFGFQTLLRLRVVGPVGLLGTFGLNGGFIGCADGGAGTGGTPTEQANHARCEALVGPTSAGGDPTLGFGLVTGRLLAEVAMGGVGFQAGWSMVAPFGVKNDEKGRDLVDFGSTHGVSVGLRFDL